ncbi:MAG: cobaltochelatase subunit CobN [Alphaproteobacteria bacterium]|jgi:cobaltochelatase CobN|nr:cobaltochelatase subunit CobN [Alphaproteobacteria bacterium]
MHLLAAKPGAIVDGSEAVDLGQSPGDIVVLSAADTELAALAQARRALGDGYPRLRLANLMQLAHPMSVDGYVEEVIAEARLVVVRLLGGLGYWRYGVEQVAQCCRRRGIDLAVVPGDDKPDDELCAWSTVDPAARDRIWHYAVQGGPENAKNLLAFAADRIGVPGFADWAEPAPLVKAGLYWPGTNRPALADLRARWTEGAPVAAVVFYRALVQGGATAPVDGLVAALAREGLNPLPVFAASLKDPVAADTLRALFEAAPPDVIVNATGFAVSSPGAAKSATPFDGADCPVLQAVFAGGTEEDWRAGTRGLSARDLAMNVALPEVDGRILARAVSFKGEAEWDPATEAAIVTYRPVPDRIAFTAALAGRWARLRRTPAAERRVAIVLANYPNKDGRLGNGVGLDTPASAVTVLDALAEAGYAIDGAPADGDALMAMLSAGPTNALEGRRERVGGVTLPLATYRAAFARLPEAVQVRVTDRWGGPEADPFVEGDAFRFGVLEAGNAVIGIQPARGYNIDPKATYHDPDLVPPHGYLAFYVWLREAFGADAIVHLGKHGNLEWLPGKAVALSDTCFPEAAFGPLPHLYPFIVNDPGEGTQAKRRAQAVIVDHLTPPLTRAESYGPLKDLEALVDEYYEAAGVDPRRLRLLSEQILDLARRIGLDADCGIGAEDDEDQALAKLDNHLCELKEMQIRDGLHVFGQAPDVERTPDLLVALARVPRGQGQGADASLIRALAADLALGAEDRPFDPLDCPLGEMWHGPRTATLSRIDSAPWRTAGDTVERLELLARALVTGDAPCDPAWTRTRAVLDHVEADLRPVVAGTGAAELDGLLRGLAGRFVAPGSSGAPTRGRLDVLPTGRNFYSVDSRTVPTPAAWLLGWKSAGLLLDRYRQEEGEWPRRLALSAWGTANMRTGGDDIAQALALMGVRPTWDTASRRVTGFEILPLDVLDRPRVDVTLRVSGFFRDAFPSQIDLVDSAARAVAALDEPPHLNPLAAAVAEEAARLQADGVPAAEAARRAGHRVFGSKPGAYGAGLQALIDERLWDRAGDLGQAFVEWGGYAYGGGTEGAAEHAAFERRLTGVEAVVHNQDNREHDLLDSDDYYQFEGGLTAAVEHLSGARPRVFHNDHSRPERPVIRTLEEEIGRVVRARAVNPKWIAGVMRHGYKGAFEIAATVDYLFAFAATTGAVRDPHFDAVYEAYLGDPAVRGFLQDNNPAAAREIAQRLAEALDRGLWQPRSNAVHGDLAALAGQGGTP